MDQPNTISNDSQASIPATRETPEHRDDRLAGQLAVKISGLNHSFGQGELCKQVLFENRLELARGEIVIMTGPSGSGKTTLLTLIGALRTVQQGSLQVMGRELHGLGSQQLVHVRRDIGFIFQHHNLFESLSSLQNIRMSMELKNRDIAAMKKRGEELLDLLGLGHRLHYRPHSLSGGQRQRVAIARALANQPSLILADEPTAALDKQSGRDVVNLLKETAQRDRTTILIVTHDNRILDVADRIVNMVDGRVVSDVVVNEAATICEFLRQVKQFKELTPGTLSEVADKMSREKHPPGAIIVRQGDPGDKFYMIRRGEAEVWVADEFGTRHVATLKEGDVFGEAALLTGEPRNATVKARSDLELYCLSKEDFQRTIQASASFKEQLLKVLFERQ